MAALGFQIHVDKENTGAIGANPKLRNGQSSGIRGKVFQDSGTPAMLKARKALGDVNTPASNRPRKALGDVNGTNEPVLRGKSGGLKPLSLNTQNFKKPEFKKLQEKSLKKQEPKTVAPVVSAPSIIPVVECEDIEQMHNQRDPDDEEDIWPARERISTYIDKLISWRPPCLFGPGNVSDEEIEEEERQIREMMGQLDALPQPVLSHAVDEPLPSAESLYVPMPHDDVPFADLTLESLDITLPSLDDSYSVVPNMGTLTLKDDF